MVKAVRGAISLNTDSEEELRSRAAELYDSLCGRNGIGERKIVSIVFSQTKDISYNPARALRLERNITRAPLFCTQEPLCADFAQPLMLRVLITFRCPPWRRIRPVYLGEAASLRRDLSC